ncbi:hypothetical protein J2X72_004728 [Phyllobacterium sp. 1468]|nr:hypothetical protein [Phyllobacterium sp. 1468]
MPTFSENTRPLQPMLTDMPSATIKHPLGYDIKIDTPLDWMGVTDHSEYVGTVALANTPGSEISKLPIGCVRRFRVATSVRPLKTAFRCRTPAATTPIRWDLLADRIPTTLACLAVRTGVVDTTADPELLLVLADGQEILQQYSPAFNDRCLKERVKLKKASRFLYGAKSHDRSTPALLYQLLSKMTISPAAGKC